MKNANKQKWNRFIFSLENLMFQKINRPRSFHSYQTNDCRQLKRHFLMPKSISGAGSYLNIDELAGQKRRSSTSCEKQSFSCSSRSGVKTGSNTRERLGKYTHTIAAFTSCLQNSQVSIFESLMLVKSAQCFHHVFFAASIYLFLKIRPSAGFLLPFDISLKHDATKLDER